MEDKRSVYEKPSLKLVKVELNECIANSGGLKVDEGSSVHFNVNAGELDTSGDSNLWGITVDLSSDKKSAW